jgi:hypothetical protein
MALTACGCGPVHLGRDPDILWWTDHETGDFTEWDQGGYHWSAEGGSTKIAELPSPTRSGRFSFESQVTSASTGVQSGAQAFRSGGLPSQAYYSAWFYLPQVITSATYLVVFKFRSRQDPADNSTTVNAWDVNVAPDGSGAMFLVLYEHSGANQWEDRTLNVPVRQWFQIEAFLRAANDSSGQITVWCNGTQLFDIAGRATTASSFVEWSVGGVTEVIDPDPTTLFIDDAAVSKRRLGPEFPVFSRE